MGEGLSPKERARRDLLLYVMQYCEGKLIKIKWSEKKEAKELRHDKISMHFLDYLDENHEGWEDQGEFWRKEFHRWIKKSMVE